MRDNIFTWSRKARRAGYRLEFDFLWVNLTQEILFLILCSVLSRCVSAVAGSIVLFSAESVSVEVEDAQRQAVA